LAIGSRVTVLQFSLFENQRESNALNEAAVLSNPSGKYSDFVIYVDESGDHIGMSILRAGQLNRAFDVLRRKFHCSGGRNKVGKGFENWGLKVFPPPESEKPR